MSHKLLRWKSLDSDLHKHKFNYIYEMPVKVGIQNDHSQKALLYNFSKSKKMTGTF